MALPAGQTGGAMVSVLPGYNSEYPSASYFTALVVYYGTTTNLNTDQFIKVSATTTNIPVVGLTRGSTYFFACTQLATNGLESDPSNFVSYTVPNKPPKGNTTGAN